MLTKVDGQDIFSPFYCRTLAKEESSLETGLSDNVSVKKSKLFRVFQSFHSDSTKTEVSLRNCTDSGINHGPAHNNETEDDPSNRADESAKEAKKSAPLMKIAALMRQAYKEVGEGHFRRNQRNRSTPDDPEPGTSGSMSVRDAGGDDVDDDEREMVRPSDQNALPPETLYSVVSKKDVKIKGTEKKTNDSPRASTVNKGVAEDGIGEPGSSKVLKVGEKESVTGANAKPMAPTLPLGNQYSALLQEISSRLNKQSKQTRDQKEAVPKNTTPGILLQQ